MKSNVGATREKLGFAGGAYIDLDVCGSWGEALSGFRSIVGVKSNVGATRPECRIEDSGFRIPNPDSRIPNPV
jgi:hypothetical protein